MKLATRPETAMGDDAIWDGPRPRSPAPLERYGRDVRASRPGEGAFYGPKIDFDLTDCPRPQVAVRHHPARLPMPERFDLEYVGPGRRAAPRR